MAIAFNLIYETQFFERLTRKYIKWKDSFYIMNIMIQIFNAQYTTLHVQIYNSFELLSYRSKIWRKNVYAHMSNTTRWFVHEFCVWLICPLRYVKRKIFHTLYLTTNFKLHLHNIMCTNIIIRCDKLSYQTRYNVVLKKSYNKMTSQNTR